MKIAVYPYNTRVDFLAEFCESMANCDKFIFVPLAGTKYLPKNTIHTKITYDIFEAINECDLIILLSGNSEIKRYYEIVKYATEHDKEIKVDEDVYGKLSDTLKKEVISLKNNPYKVSRTDNVLREIDVPVISVMSMGDNLKKFNIQMKLKTFFESAGYRVLVIATHELSELFDVVRMPQFMFDNYSFTKKVLDFNQFVYDEIRRYKPDLVIIGCPGGIMPYNRYIHNYFGEIPYIVSKAVPIDINIVSTYFVAEDSDQKQFFESLDQYCKENFECEMNFFTLCNIYMNYNRERNIVEYLVFDKDTVKKYLESASLLNVFDCLDQQSVKNMFSGIKHILETDFQVM